MKKKDITGQRFGRILVLRFSGMDKYGKATWLCKCDCGIEKIICGVLLRNGNVKSCGCLNREVCIKRSTKHGDTEHPLWRMWRHMKQRCDKKYYSGYKYWGGRGITYDPKWIEYLEFKKDMEWKYIWAKRKFSREAMSLERLDVNGNYNFNNCVFIPKRFQSKNTRTTREFWAESPEGETFLDHNQSDFAKEHDLCRASINRCLTGQQKEYKGWTFKFVKKPKRIKLR